MRKMQFRMSQWFTGCILFALLWIGIIQPIINTWKYWPWDAFFQPFYVFYCMFGWEWPYVESFDAIVLDGGSPIALLFMLLGIFVAFGMFVIFITGIVLLARYTYKGRLF